MDAQLEKKILREMIGLYCRKNHKTKTLCPDCARLEAYALERIEKCPFRQTKTFCSSCKVHCYRKEMRQEIRKVMAFSGPRLLLSHPVLVVRHGLETLKDKKRKDKNP